MRGGRQVDETEKGTAMENDKGKGDKKKRREKGWV